MRRTASPERQQESPPTKRRSFAVPIRIGVNARHLDGPIARIIDRSRQHLLQLFRSLGALSIGSRSWMLDDGLALTEMGQASDQDQSYCVHLVSAPCVSITNRMVVVLSAVDFHFVNDTQS